VSPFVWSQVLAGIAFACGVASFQLRSRRQVLLCLTALTAFNATHFLLLERPGAAALLLLTGVRYVAAIFSTDRRLMYLFMAAAPVALLADLGHPLGLLALAAVLVGTYGSFRSEDRVLRLCFMAGNATWMVHNALARTPVAAVMEASFLASNLLGYWRFHGRQARAQG
jgi:hypothetical protein